MKGAFIMSGIDVDPLDEVITKSDEVEGDYRRLLADLLKPHIRIDPEKGSIYFMGQPPKLNTKQHVLTFLLAKLAMSQKNPEIAPIATSKEIEEGTGLPGGTVRPKLSELFNEKVISKGSSGYFIESINLYKARSILETTLDDGNEGE